MEVVGKNSAGVWQEFAEATVSPNWTVQPGAGGVVINEVLAINRSLPLGSAGTTDYIELTNTGGTAVDLSGYSLTDDPSAPAQFVFPGGTSLAPGGYAVVYAGAAPGGAGFFAPFALSGEGESVYLYNASSQLVDTVAFGPQVADHSVGRIGRDRAWDLALPSPGAANAAAPQCPPDAIVLNEWLAANNVRITNDFVELYNPLPLPCPLAGLRLGDSIRPAESDHVIAPLSFCAGEGFAVFWADGDGKNGPEGAGENAAHLRFKLDSNYEWLGLYSAAGDQMDLVHFQSQSKDVSVGRSPDGTTGQYQALVVPTPGATNATTSENGPGDPTPVTFTAMTDTFRYNDNDVDYYNASPAFYERTFDASSWPQGAGPFGVDNDLGSGAFGTSLDLNPPTTHYIRGTFTFNGDLSRLQNIELRTFVDDGAIFYLNGTEIHRMQMPGGDISHEDFASRSNPNGDPTVEGPFSVPANLIVNGLNVLAASVHQDDGSSGDVGIGMSLTGELAAEPDPESEIRYAEMVVLADSLRITEMFFNPPGSGDDLEFIELQNTGGSTLALGGVRLSGAVEFTFPEMDLPPGDTVVVVANRPVFELTFGSAMRIAGEYSGRLSNGGEKIRLQLPDPYIANILSFDYNDAWYPATDGGGSSLRFAGSLSSSPLEAWDDAAYWEENPTPDPGGFTAQVIDDFPSWSAANAVTGADGDEDHDGIAHLVEYGLLLSPNDGSGANGPAGLPIIGTSPDNRATLTFEVPSTPWGDLAYAVEASSSVHGPWITIKQKAAGATQWTGLGITSVSAGSAGRDRVTVADLPTIGGANTRRFLRLRFILQ
ncbi:MAG: lamin tail domain-containing protein [Verrucomicrobiales bacterium]